MLNQSLLHKNQERNYFTLSKYLMMTYIFIIENTINEQGNNVKHSVNELPKEYFEDMLFVLLV